MSAASTISRRALLTGMPHSAERSAAPPTVAPTAAVARIAVISDPCLARAGITCMSCRDACYRDAIRLRPRIGGPFLPEVITSACTGCGACVAPCPSNAIALSEVLEGS